jgi:hypothetical protein
MGTGRYSEEGLIVLTLKIYGSLPPGPHISSWLDGGRHKNIFYATFLIFF